MSNTIVPFSQELAFALYESTDQYPVEFDAAWEWLGYSKKANALRALVQFGFKEHTDWSSRLSKTIQGGRPSESLYLTVECFKMWGMMAGTEQGKQIRLYFLECERIAKEKQANLTPCEMLLESAQRLVDQERRTLALEKQNKLHAAKLESHAERLEGVETEVGRYSNGHGDYYSIVAYAKILGMEMPLSRANDMGKVASKICRKGGITPQPVRDPRFGTVNSYPESILKQLTW